MFLILLNILLFIFIVYKLNYNSKQSISERTTYEQLQQRIRYLEYASESKEYKHLFYIGKDTIHSKIYDGELPVLICNFSVKSCAPCYETMLDIITKVFPDYKERDDIIFLSNDLEFKYRDSFYGKKIYSNVVDNNLRIEKSGIPYLFILNTDLKTDLVLHSDKNNPSMTENYLNTIKEILLSKK